MKLISNLRKSAPDTVQVLDVGHANFTTAFCAKHDPIFHFDVGWPIGFNKHTVSRKVPNISAAPVVILSHWDWDHLHGYHVWPELKEKVWVAPVQDLGPGALKVAQALRDAGKLLSFPSTTPFLSRHYRIGSLSIGNCDPTHAKTKSQVRNNSGLFLGLKLANGRKVFLPGDANYHAISWPYKSPPDLLVVSHHGAAIDGAIQMPSKPNARAVISMGKGNVYRHPCVKTLRKHQKIGWNLSSTSTWMGAPRGNRVLS